MVELRGMVGILVESWGIRGIMGNYGGFMGNCGGFMGN